MQSFGTILLLLLSSAALVLLGHVFRLLRWEQFIRIYEYPQRRSLLVLRTVNVVFTTLLSLPLPFDEGGGWLIWPFLVLSLVIIVWTIVVMNTFQASLRDGMGEEPAQ